MALQLVVYDGDRAVRRVALAHELLIGKGPDCTLQLADVTVSRQHAQILEEGGRFVIEDLGSHNKTVIENGAALAKGQRATLQSGMVVRLGKIRIRIEEEPSADLLPTVIPELDATQLPAAPERNEVRKPTPAPPAPAPTPRPSTATLAPALPAPGDSGTILGPVAEDPALVAHGFLASLRPRLIVDNDLCRQVVEIAEGGLTIGRKNAALTIPHKMVSESHARIFYEPMRLFLEDLDSTHETYLNGEKLRPGVPREIPPEAHLRFGPIDALFVMEKNYDGGSLASQCAKAVAILADSIGASQMKKGQEEARKHGVHPGAGLILAGAVTVPQWVQALADAKIALVNEKFGGKQARVQRILIAVLLVALLALLALFLLKE